jgi:hypothetical protein
MKRINLTKISKAEHYKLNSVKIKLKSAEYHKLNTAKIKIKKGKYSLSVVSQRGFLFFLLTSFNQCIRDV